VEPGHSPQDGLAAAHHQDGVSRTWAKSISYPPLLLVLSLVLAVSGSRRRTGRNLGPEASSIPPWGRSPRPGPGRRGSRRQRRDQRPDHRALPRVGGTTTSRWVPNSRTRWTRPSSPNATGNAARSSPSQLVGGAKGCTGVVSGSDLRNHRSSRGPGQGPSGPDSPGQPKVCASCGPTLAQSSNVIPGSIRTLATSTPPQHRKDTSRAGTPPLDHREQRAVTIAGCHKRRYTAADRHAARSRHSTNRANEVGEAVTTLPTQPRPPAPPAGLDGPWAGVIHHPVRATMAASTATGWRVPTGRSRPPDGPPTRPGPQTTAP